MITFFLGIAIRGPIPTGHYQVRDKRLQVLYPPAVNLGFAQFEMPKSLSTLFIVSWEDASGRTTEQLKSKSFEKHLPIYQALDAISELLLAYKLVRIGHSDGIGIRTIGSGDRLFSWSEVDGQPTGDLNIGLKRYSDNSAWAESSTVDPHETTPLAMPHIGADSLPLARRYVRCYELLEHGFYSEAFLVAFSVLDDFIQETLHQLLLSKGLKSRDESEQLLRGIKDNRLKIYLGPVLKLACGLDLQAMWPGSGKAIEWLNKTRNDIAHSATQVEHATAAKGIFACLRILVAFKVNGIGNVDLNVELFRHAKITAAWTLDKPAWVPSGEASESMDFRS